MPYVPPHMRKKQLVNNNNNNKKYPNNFSLNFSRKALPTRNEMIYSIFN